jgi:hypothetical protein
MSASVEVKYNQLLEENAALTRIIKQLKATIHGMQIEKAATERAAILRDAMLPEVSVARINAAFANSTNNAGIFEAINVERRMPATKQDLRTEKLLARAGNGVVYDRRTDRS